MRLPEDLNEPEPPAGRKSNNFNIDRIILEGLNTIVKGCFEEKLAAAKAVLADREASQDEVNQAWRELSYVIHLLDFTADKSVMEELIQEAEALNLNLYEEDKDDQADR